MKSLSEQQESDPQEEYYEKIEILDNDSFGYGHLDL